MHVRKRLERLMTKGETKELFETLPAVVPKIRTRMMQFCSGAYSSEQARAIRNQLERFELKEFELVNLIDTKPTGLVHLQNIIEELTERFDEKQMDEILDVFTAVSSSK